MRVGLLQCDHIDERHRSIGGDYLDMFERLLPELDLVPYDAIGGVLPASADECDGWIATGSRHSVYEELDWIVQLRAFVSRIHDAGVAFVGSCFGHQLLAHSVGGRTARAAGWGAGAHDLTVTEKEPWMEPAAPSLRLLYMHQDQVVELPPGGVVLGSTEHCPNALIRVGPSMVGLQAHPEFPAEFVAALLHAREERIGHDAVKDALTSLDAPRDEHVAAAWICRILQQ